MFSLNESLNYYLYPRYISMGKGVDCLCELIRQDMKAASDVYKRQDRGLYRFEWETFFMIMRGIPLRSGRWRKRFKM